jgi:hypothetical protein
VTALAGGRGLRRRRRAVVIEPGQGQEVRGLEVVSGEAFHRVTGSASAAARPGIWPGDLQRAPAASPDARHYERHDHGDGEGQAGGVRSYGSPG